MLILIYTEPLEPLAILPATKPTLDLLTDLTFTGKTGLVLCQPVLLTTLPIALVYASVWPFVNTKTVLLFITVLTHVLLLVTPDILAIAVHESVLPLADVAASIFPLDYAVAIDLVDLPVAIIAGPVGPQVRTFTLLDSVTVLTQILRPVWPLFFTLAVHLTCVPLASVHCPICVPEDTIATHHVPRPAPFVNLTTWIGKLAVPTSLVALPDARVTSTIWPLHCALAMAHPSQPLASIPGIRAAIDVHFDF